MSQLADSGELQHLTPERVWKETQRSISGPNPQIFFEVLRQCNALKVLFPEVEALYGVPNPKQWHPEVDTGIHTLMVLKAAAQLSPESRIRFAAFTHDLGKAKTPSVHWPSHRGHETIGLPLINAMCDRFKIPNDHRELALLVGELHGNTHKALELRAKTIVKMFDKTDAWRKPERFAEFLVACEADHRGRLGFEQLPYPQADYLMRCLEAASTINVQEVIQKGHKGAAIKEQLNVLRINAVDEVKNIFKV